MVFSEDLKRHAHCNVIKPCSDGPYATDYLQHK